jgi:prefoldin subunit 5
LETVKDVVPVGVTGPQPGGTGQLLNAFAKNADAMNSIFDKLANLDPTSADYQSQLFNLQQQLNQLQQANTMISQIMSKMNELADRVIQNLR